MHELLCAVVACLESEEFSDVPRATHWAKEELKGPGVQSSKSWWLLDNTFGAPGYESLVDSMEKSSWEKWGSLVRLVDHKVMSSITMDQAPLSRTHQPASQNLTCLYLAWVQGSQAMSLLLLYPPVALKYGSRPSSILITWELIRNANSWAHPRLTGLKTLGVGSSHLCFNKHSWWFGYVLTLENYYSNLHT